MTTIRDAGTPRDAELPTLTSRQIDGLVDRLISLPVQLENDRRDPLTVTPLHSEQVGPERTRRWHRWAGAAAVAAAVAITVVAATPDRPSSVSSSGGPTPIVQAPAPNFDCWMFDRMARTDRAVFLPAEDSGRQVTMGFVGDTLCISVLPNGGGSTVPAAGLAPGPIRLFGSAGYGGDQYAEGLVDRTITRITYVPDDTSVAPRDAAALVDLGSDRAFVIPDVDDGTVAFYRGSVLVSTRELQRSHEPMVEPTPTGLPCDPTVSGARLNSSNLVATGVDGDVMFTEVWLEPIAPGQPAPTDRRLCLLVQSSRAALSAAAEKRSTEGTVAYLETTSGDGGTFIWGRLNGTVSRVALTDATGATTQLPDDQLDSTRSGQLSFVTFVPDDAAPIRSLQAKDVDGQPVGDPVDIP